MRISRILSQKLIIISVLLAPIFAEARARFSWDDHQVIDKKWPKAVESSTGFRYVVLQEGKGDLPNPGDKIFVTYVGMFLDGKVFDQNIDKEKPFTFRHGRGEVIKGWEEGLARMRVGERQIFIVPAELAYGTRGRPPDIPRSTALVFEVELLGIDASK